ncbi:uncharacterized protein NECHADRAFT_53109 [Fusarium vanettenii 77-13-4]|uniref:Uncharacterized protein n=1 Tax=Fusarium vanettenii (strain ATCC MYA-4622 / CBS 123669 / FGSC 9596 / NRRL 45880 / 77-13-4) TaxID=660122 RepID=C7ZIQ9_FUSV7|nr:uncharacterized protein NECHADRAFT_53109 [Fusarium vanettenii 77-13-4]EEU36071.1 hypothetical protein NECHADRAFT_53109 [Fusarium vanettenii 77-13-4]
MPSSLVTSILWTDPDEPLLAKVIGAEPSATTYLLGCTPEPDGRECSMYHAAVTLGPWASETPSPGVARTGNFDFYISDSIDPWKFSMHCEMTGTVPQKCTTINIGGNDDGHPTATFGSKEMEEEGLGEFGYATLTITGGLELLAATHSGSHETATASTEDSAHGTSTPEATSVASSCKARVITAISMAGVAMAVVIS